MGWGSGAPKMGEETELEEGEAYDDDTSMDPEIALSYLDEKVQSILGHVQKDFEEGVSAENLGAKFGGYGSFLPTYRRSPSIWSQPKSPQRVQTHSTIRSPNYLCREVGGQTATALHDASLTKRNGTAVTCGVHLSHDKMVPLGDGSVRQDYCLSSAQLTEKLPARHQPSPNKSFNTSDQRTLKFRIKVGSDKTMKKNAATYSGLGLTSPSSSMGNSPGESGGNLFESQETSNETSSSILQMLTSFTISGGLLVSPLHNNFVNLISNFPMEGNKPEATVKLKHDHSTTSAEDSMSRLDDEDLLTRELTETVGKSEKHKEPRCGNGMAFEDDTQFRLKDNARAKALQRKLSFRDSAIETFREHENSVILRKWDASKDKAKDLSGTELVKDGDFGTISGQSVAKFDGREAKSSSVEWIRRNQIKSSQNDFPVDHSEGMRNKTDRIPASLKADSYISEGERDSKGGIDHVIQKASESDTSHERDELTMPVSAKKLSFESKKKLNGGQVKGKPSLDSAEESKRAGVSASTKEKGIKRDACKVHDMFKDLFDTNPEPRSKPVDVLENRFGERMKESKFETLKEKQAHAARLKEKPRCSKFDKRVASGTLMKDPLNDTHPSNNGLTLVTEQATVAPAIIQEQWVGCDLCLKWRLLPYGTKPEDLPEKWVCSMLNWLPGMNDCKISEEETTKALNVLYYLPVPENQHGVQNHADTPANGVHSVDEHFVNQNHQSVGFDYMANGSKKTHKMKETFVTVSKAKDFQHDLVRRGSSKDIKRPLVGKSPIKNSSGQLLSKSDFAVKKHLNRQKQEHVTGDDAKPKRKSNRESDQYERDSAKKRKIEGASDMNNFQASAAKLGRSGISSKNILPTMASMKDNKTQGKRDYSKDAKSEERNGLLASVKKPREGASGLAGSGSVDMMRKSNHGKIFLKKRKVKDWQNCQNYSETFQNDEFQLHVRSMPVKEDTSDGGLRRNKKPRVSQTDGKESSKSKSNAESEKKDMKTRVLSSACNNIIDKNSDKTKNLNKHRLKITSQLTMEDLESLKKDLGCEQVSTTVTSSSSKVSDSCKNRMNQELKGSPVESVSSSPMKMSSLNNLSLAKLDLGLYDVKVGDFPIKGSPRKLVDRFVNYVTQHSGTAKKRKNSDFLNPESAENPVPDLRKTDARDNFGRECKLVVKSSSLFGNAYLDNDDLDTLEGHNACLTDKRASEPCYSKNRIGRNQQNTVLLQQESGKASCLVSKDKGRNFDLNSEGAIETVSGLPNEHGVLNPRRSSRVETEIDRSHIAACGVLQGDVKQPFLDQSGLKSVKADNNISKRESRKLLDDSGEKPLQPEGHGRSGVKLGDSCCKDETILMQHDLIKISDAEKNITTRQDCRDEKSLVDHHPEDEYEVLPSASKLTPGAQNGSFLHVRTHDLSTCSNALKVSKDNGSVVHQNEPRQIMGNSAPDQSVERDLSGPSLVRRDVFDQIPHTVLKEAEDLRDYADNLKNVGFSFECNEVYFQAALKFLHGASLLERNSENSKPREMNQIQIYIYTAKLCESCAHEYERQQEMAAAALAYKCMEVAYMKVVYCKNTGTNRLWHDLQASLQIVPQGESPSSSASDIDNLNDQALAEKAFLSKSNGFHPGNHVIAPQNHSSIFRLLDFTKAVNSAMEASRKSQNALAAANVILEEAQNKERIVAVKRVINLSFQDVEELVRLVRIAFEPVGGKSFTGSRD